MIVLTVLGTLVCIAVAFAVDSYSFEEGVWRMGDNPRNNVLIPLLVAPPFFFYLLSKLRQLAIAHEKLLIVASTDGLTSCMTRSAFATVVDAYLDRFTSGATDTNGALLVIDVDHFKRVNDDHGHDQGDEALRLIARTIRGSLREIDLVGRIGGEEFSVFLPGLSSDAVELIAERIRSAVAAATFEPNGHVHGLSVSVGGATFASSTSFTQLYKSADRRLYDAKRNGRNRVEISRVSDHIPHH